MNSLNALLGHNVAYLEQAVELLGALDDETYTDCAPPAFTSSLGDHMRHVLEHYTCFLDGAAGGRIDYDGRPRDGRVATDRDAATAAAARIADRLAAFGHPDGPVRVRLDGSDDEGDGNPWSDSTLKRELQYLQAHTVHHFALIAVLMRLLGREPNPAFGVAPSTLRHLRARSEA